MSQFLIKQIAVWSRFDMVLLLDEHKWVNIWFSCVLLQWMTCQSLPQLCRKPMECQHQLHRASLTTQQWGNHSTMTCLRECRLMLVTQLPHRRGLGQATRHPSTGRHHICRMHRRSFRQVNSSFRLWLRTVAQMMKTTTPEITTMTMVTYLLKLLKMSH